MGFCGCPKPRIATLALAKFEESNRLDISLTTGVDLGVVGTTCDEMVTEGKVTEVVTRVPVGSVTSSIAEKVSDAMKVLVTLWVLITIRVLVAIRESVADRVSRLSVAIRDFLLPFMGGRERQIKRLEAKRRNKKFCKNAGRDWLVPY